MQVSRRDFLKYCSTLAAAMGISSLGLKTLADAVLNPGGPKVLWLQGAGCSGCSVSFLNLVSTSPPHGADDVLIDLVNLMYHPTLMASAGEQAFRAARKTHKEGGYILAVEGGVPTAFDGSTCWVSSTASGHWTFETVVRAFANNASHIICVGECSAYGGIPAAPPNPTGIVGVKEFTGRTTINVAGCPPHPDWIVWVVAQLLAGGSISLDSQGRPTALFNQRIHQQCPLRNAPEAWRFGQEGYCFEELGCRGEQSSVKGDCPSRKFNDGVNWCLGAGAPCFGCTSHTFPGTQPFFSEDNNAR